MLYKLSYPFNFSDIQLECYNSNIIKPIKHDSVNDYINDFNFFEQHPQQKICFDYFNSIFTLKNYKIHFQSSGKNIDWHIDNFDSDKLRFIMPIISFENVLSYIDIDDNVYEFVMFPGNIYHFDIQLKHKVHNLSKKHRIALIFDIENTLKNKQIIIDMFQKII